MLALLYLKDFRSSTKKHRERGSMIHGLTGDLRSPLKSRIGLRWHWAWRGRLRRSLGLRWHCRPWGRLHLLRWRLRGRPWLNRLRGHRRSSCRLLVRVTRSGRPISRVVRGGPSSWITCGRSRRIGWIPRWSIERTAHSRARNSVVIHMLPQPTVVPFSHSTEARQSGQYRRASLRPFLQAALRTP